MAAGRTSSTGKVRDHGPDRTVLPAAVASGEYKIGGPNSPELLARMFPVTGTDANVSQNFVDGRISGELMTLPGGPLSLAVGGELRQEKMSIKSTDNIMNAEIINRGSLLIDGSRDLSAVFMELNAPVLKSLELNGALRYDKAPGFSGHVSPKLGARWTVTPELMFRATTAGGFRAPNIPETLGQVGVTGFFNNTKDPKRCATATEVRNILKGGDKADQNDAATAYNSGCLTSVPAMISSSSDLKPETSRSITLGMVLEPVKNISIAIDYFKIERKNEIAYRDVPYVLAREDQPGYSDKLKRNEVSITDRRLTDRANALKPGANLAFTSGSIQSLMLSYENFGKTESSGIDLDITGRFGDSSTGKITVGLATTIGLKLRSWDVDANAYRPNTIGLYQSPRVTSVLSAAWNQGPWTVGTRVNYVSGTALNSDETDFDSFGEAACRRDITDTLPCRIGADWRTDVNVAYTGIKNLRLSMIINNVFDQQLPIDLNGGYKLRPRTMKVGAEYKF
ncbi:TonB-dependent receptor domain-containing protein [Janthinobacterium sp.]|uniref:TonB-dependent receptor domain-containing protein n=1 Tax=Janthinobacterium sp. TaxID=1871054 RepID=UPI00293D70E3|nr:TonB-dependent receptor [Janthinobacterium sp.]